MATVVTTETGLDEHRLDEHRLDEHRRELRGHCYRMLGSAFDAEDAVQETLLRAWRARDRFEGRAALRSWLYRIATNVCLDMLSGRARRARPMDLSSAAWAPVEASLAARRPGTAWVEPMLDARVLPAGASAQPSASPEAHGDPAEVAVVRESVRLAFVAALQHLPPRQRAVLLLRDVARYRAEEVAGLLGTSVAAVNSALQRARATLASRRPGDGPGDGQAFDPLDRAQQDLLARYLAAFEAYDVERLVALLCEDATQSMPPYAMWLRGRESIAAWLRGPGRGCAGSRLLPVVVNGAPGFAQYRASGPGGRGGRHEPRGHEPWALHALDVADGQVLAITSFLDTRLFPLLDLPADPSSSRPWTPTPDAFHHRCARC